MSQELWNMVVKPERTTLEALRSNFKDVVATPHKIGGLVTVDGTPGKKRIMAFHRGTGVLLRTTFSDKDTGKWEMRGMFENNPNIPTDPKNIVVLAIDDENDYNGEIFDFVTRKPDKET